MAAQPVRQGLGILTGFHLSPENAGNQLLYKILRKGHLMAMLVTGTKALYVRLVYNTLRSDGSVTTYRNPSYSFLIHRV